MVDTHTLVMCCTQFVELTNTLSFTSLMVDSFDDLDILLYLPGPFIIYDKNKFGSKLSTQNIAFWNLTLD